MFKKAIKLFGCLFLTLAFSITDNAQGHTSTSPEPTDKSIEPWQQEMLKLVNQLRAIGCKCGDHTMPPAKPLKWNALLANAALLHAQDMNREKFIGHYGSNGSRIGQRVDAAGYNWKSVGENAAWLPKTVQGVMYGWEDSPGHCRSMMSRSYKEMGAAHVGAHWVQVFASPMK